MCLAFPGDRTERTQNLATTVHLGRLNATSGAVDTIYGQKMLANKKVYAIDSLNPVLLG
jgi:hypothetical protein